MLTCTNTLLQGCPDLRMWRHASSRVSTPTTRSVSPWKTYMEPMAIPISTFSVPHRWEARHSTPHRTRLRRPHCQSHVQLETQVLRIVSPTPRVTFAHRTEQGRHVVVGEGRPVSLCVLWIVTHELNNNSCDVAFNLFAWYHCLYFHYCSLLISFKFLLLLVQNKITTS